jgi:F-type H+-transporting ATPase subunit b
MLRRTITPIGLLAFWLIFGFPALRAAEPVQDKGHDAAVATKGEPGKVEEAHGEAPKSEPNILKPELPLAAWSLVVFVFLLLFLGKFAWKPLMKALEEREAHLEQVLLDSERARNEAEALAAQHRREMSQAADQVRALIEEARKEAQVAADSIHRKAQAEAEAARKRAERDIVNARDQALMEIWSNTAELAVSVAGRVLNKEMSESDHRRLVEAAIGELPANGQQGARA